MDSIEGLCEYCTTQKLIQPDDYVVLWLDGSILHMEFESYCNYEYEINYCPMCGRKLGEKQ